MVRDLCGIFALSIVSHKDVETSRKCISKYKSQAIEEEHKLQSSVALFGRD